MENIEKLVKRMLIEDPFYGFMLTSLDRKYSNRVPTIAVHFNGNLNAELLVNKEWFEQWNEQIQMGLLKHELLHLAFKHIIMLQDFPNAELFNIAADLEVNCYIKDLPEQGQFVRDYGFPERQGTLYYYRELLKQQQQREASNNKDEQKPCAPGGFGGDGVSQNSQDTQDSNDSSGQGQSGNDESNEQQQSDNSKQCPQQQTEKKQERKTFDDHTVWEEQENTQAQEVVGAFVDDILLKTAEGMKSRGFIPGELAGIIADLQKPLKPVFDWKKAFRRFLGNAYTEHKKRSRRKESRRFAGSAGAQHKKRSDILVAFDTSGSVSDYELREFVSELTYMHKTGTHIHVLECDARIQREYDFTPGCIKGVAGRGGTRFEPVIDYYKEHYKQYETLIYFTDGGASLDFTVPQNNMLWVISSAGCVQDYPGKAIYIPKLNQ